VKSTKDDRSSSWVVRDYRPFDTALPAYSGQAVDHQEATGEPADAVHLPTATQWQAGADTPGIRVGEYWSMINQRRLLLSPRGDLSACSHRQMDNTPRSCCGSREKTSI